MPAIHLPFISQSKELYPCNMSELGYEVAKLLVSDPRQQREVFACDKTLTEIAKKKADDMIQRRYTDHVTPDGKHPNQLVREGNFALPSWFENNNNNVESISAGFQTAKEVVDNFYKTNHKYHVFGLNDFFKYHDLFGIEYRDAHRYASNQRGTKYSTYCVILTAPSDPEKYRRILLSLL